MFKNRVRMFFNELKVLLLMRSGSSSRSDSGGGGPDPEPRIGASSVGSCGCSPLGCSHPNNQDAEDYYGNNPRPQSLSLEEREAKGLDTSLPSLSEISIKSPQCRICFQGPDKGELLSPCRCDGSVRCTHQSCLIRWISERGSWSCELCLFKYHVLAISTKNPLQWQWISLSVIERVQIAAVVLGSLFLLASVSWLVWSSLSPSAKWQRQDLLFQICYAMYGFMDIVCIGLIIHEGSAVFRIFKRWQAVNQQWRVLNYEKSKDLGEPSTLNSKSGERASASAGGTVDSRGHPIRRYAIRTIFHQNCGFTLLHVLNQIRARGLHRRGQEVVMRVTTV
ncbi:E3 ubiquitin-protein ligase MARCHF9-like [Boleophthalmus pectinirostris]|uniref:E3 ubiquitin-protein ligase MARCHF9-like n=1 Tax=Boleophthalmus pectinirostris TaxID=150288 RepID=UPI000A1C54E4|nr:E3 ubiquitin-protein ligase MARCHF9-like [Boleophthalmus pectinirostris]